MAAFTEPVSAPCPLGAPDQDEPCLPREPPPRDPYLPQRMLQESRVTNKTHIIDLQFEFLATHFRLGGQNCCQDDI